jgi:hypothetical protein
MQKKNQIALKVTIFLEFFKNVTHIFYFKKHADIFIVRKNQFRKS